MWASTSQTTKGGSPAIRVAIRWLAVCMVAGLGGTAWYYSHGRRSETSGRVAEPPTASRPAPHLPRPGPFTLVDVAKSVGLRFRYFRGETGRLWTVEPHGGGVCWLDFDSDGRQDLFFVNGTQLPPDPADRSHRSQLFRNLGRVGFLPVSDQAAITVSMYGQGCSSADYDNDGFADLMVTGWRACQLWHNNGDGTFRDVTKSAGTFGGQWNMGACFADLDRDGDLDLYLANYVQFDPSGHSPCLWRGLRSYCGPAEYAALQDFLYCNLGDGRFQDVSRSAGIVLPRGPAFGAVAADADNDGWPDLLVANDGRPNFLFRNLGAESPTVGIRLQEVAAERGIALNAQGLPEADMGIACGDIDGNGFLDFGMSHYYQEHYTLYQNLGPPGFKDSTELFGLDYTTRSKMGWGTHFVDLDADGWLDLFVVNGHINDHAARGIPYRMSAQLFRNQSGERFREVSERSGPYFRQLHIARGTAVGDYDEDGRQDVVVVHHDAAVALLANRTDSPNHFMVLRLVGVASNRDGTNVRAVVRLRRAGGDGQQRVLIRESVAGEGYLGSNDKRVWFGLGRCRQAELLEVRWPSGRFDRFEAVEADCEYRLTEGRPLRCLRRYRSK